MLYLSVIKICIFLLKQLARRFIALNATFKNLSLDSKVQGLAATKQGFCLIWIYFVHTLNMSEKYVATPMLVCRKWLSYTILILAR